MTRSLVAYAPWEGFHAWITGDKGRLEIYEKHGSHIIAGQGDEELAAAQAVGAGHAITVFPMFKTPYDVEIPKAEGGHGGGDPILLADVFARNPPPDPRHRAAGHIDGAASILLGISANESIRSGAPVRCRDLVPLPA
ncbi:MAG: Gfo/Idh/MocA family oxidoreductase [Verrucomicrobia bacterium]|nr:Gfo/Idh/MocA family oxidoreductase [Verrucomicrobiota bacterium]MDA1085569.1 Gfo/Idh/MocA family oxidoreductase [Verrucomicrobiota bacterium]